MAIVLAVALGACGDDGDDGAADSTVMSDDTMAEDTTDDTMSDDSDMDDDSDTEAPRPDERSGTIVIAGTTNEIADADFGICETVNPAFDTAINIIADLDDGTKFRLNGDLDDMDDEFDGLFLGDIPDEERAEDLEVERDGRTVRGTAVVSEGDVEFTFTC